MKKHFFPPILLAVLVLPSFLPGGPTAAGLCPGGRCSRSDSSSLNSLNSWSSASSASSARNHSIPQPQQPNYRTQYAAPHAAVARILVENAQTQIFGTGTWIQLSEGRCVVLTCAHLFETDYPEHVAVNFPNQPAFDAKIQAIDRRWDLALLQAAAEFPLSLPKPVTLSTSAPREGEMLRVCGLGPDGTSLWILGTTLGYCRLNTVSGNHTLVMTGNARQGDSGSPILRLDGTLAAVLWGTDGNFLYGTWSGQIRTVFETAFRENWDEKRDEMRVERDEKRAERDEMRTPQEEKEGKFPSKKAVVPGRFRPKRNPNPDRRPEMTPQYAQIPQNPNDPQNFAQAGGPGASDGTAVTQNRSKRFPGMPLFPQKPLCVPPLISIRFPWGLTFLYLILWLVPIGIMYAVFKRRLLKK